ncbi:LytTR family DNA-binding domain-containing protein [Bacteroides fragilis]
MDKIEFREDKITFSYKKSYGECLYQDLIAVEYSKPYCILQIGGRNSILFLISLRVILEKLPADFLLINRGIIVNKERIVDCVLQDGAYHIKMDNNKIYRISTRKLATVKKYFMVQMILFRFRS